MDEGPTSFLSTINFGNGLIEIAALTTLIGSTTAGDLILGNRGAAGLVWGSISAFGASSVIRACASAASPGWLRQMLGLRTPLSDKATGMDLSLAPGKKVAKRIRGTMEDTGPLGVSCLADDPDGTVSLKFATVVAKSTQLVIMYSPRRSQTNLSSNTLIETSMPSTAQPLLSSPRSLLLSQTLPLSSTHTMIMHSTTPTTYVSRFSYFLYRY